MFMKGIVIRARHGGAELLLGSVGGGTSRIVNH